MLTLDKVYHAAYVLKDVVRHTELIPSPVVDGCKLYLKPENLQLTGSFKVRGSAYKISQLSAEEKEKGVIACSAGNHAQGVALAATKYGIKSLICLPEGEQYTLVVTGDVDGDGESGIFDLTAIKRQIVNGTGLSGAALLAADVDGSGTVDLFDYVAVRKYILSGEAF